MKKRLLSIVLVLTCLLAVCPLQVSALAKPHVHTDPTSGIMTDSTPTVVNPLYADIWEPEPFPESVTDVSDYDLAPAYSEYLSWDEGVQAMRDHMKLRDGTFTIYYTTETYVTNAESTEDNPSTTNVMFDQALLHTGVPTEGDYLYRHYRQWNSSANRSYSNGLYYVALTMNMTYSDTAAQQPIMDAAVNDLLADLNVYNASDYEKVCAVYDYICANVVYDYDRLEDDSYTLKYTAYAALVNGIAVCQGYSNLFYRLMLELGVDTRVIRGYSFDDNHAWNIVQLNGLYYNVDSTWDAGETNYSYFLRSPYTFADHERRTEYETAEFHSEYPMGSADYNPANPEQPPQPSGAESGTFGDGLTWTLYEDGELRVSGSGAIPDYSDSSDSFAAPIAERIVRVVIEEGITSVGTNAFCGCTALSEVEFASSVTSIGAFAFSGCALTELNLPSTVVSLGNYPFEYCTSLTSAYIPASVTSMGHAPFSGCSALTDLRVDSGNPNYCTDSHGVIYNKEMTRLIQMPGGFAGTYAIPNGVIELGQWSFENCTGLTSVDIPESVTTISQGVFSGAALTEVTIPSGVTTVQKYAFLLCPALSSVTLPASVTTIEDGVFRDCSALTDVYYGGTQEQWSNVFIGANNSGLDFATIHYAETEHTHTYTTEVTPPTCTEDGFTTYTCECGDSYVSDTVEALGHDWGEWVVTTQPTATSTGEKTATCTRCQETKTETIPMLEGTTEQSPAVSSNKDGYNYINADRWTTPIYSYLTWENDGYTRVEAIGSVLTVERYNSDMQFLSRRDIPLELPLFGGAYICADYNFVVVGQENYNEDNSVEVIRLIRYTKDWERVDSTGLFGANTIVPFNAGSLRFARYADKLYVRTCHKMYQSSDGLNHQANLTFCVDLTSMTVTDQLSKVWNSGYGYVSHSFNQFIQVDGNTLLAVDHGDALPRSVILFKYGTPADSGTVYTRTQSVNVLNIADSTGHYNDTGVALGGFEYSNTHYLVAGNSTTQAGGINFRGYQRNIFVTATPKDNFSDSATTITWITDYDEGTGVELGTPQMTKLTDGRFFLMWTADGVINCCYITADGKLDGSVFEAEGDLSDCTPIQVGEQLVWYVTDYSAPVFYTIDLTDLGEVVVPHTHTYTGTVTAPTCDTEGFTTYTCVECGHTYTDDPTEPTGHDWSEWTVTVEPTTSSEGTKSRECANCGETETGSYALNELLEPIESTHPYTEHMDQTWTHTIPGALQLLVSFDLQTYLEDGFDHLFIYDGSDTLVGRYSGTELAGQTITVPGDTVKIRMTSDQSIQGWGFRVTSIVPSYESTHEHSYTAAVTPPTCTEQGYTTYTCSCGDSYTANYVNPTGHNWSAWEVSVPPTETVPGEEIRECANCGETETRTMDPIVHTHSYTSVVVTAPTCTQQGYTTYTCSCGDSYTANYVQPTGHIWGAWQTIKPATQTQTGEELHECSVCRKVETRTVPMIPSVTFTDVPAGAWFTDAVNWAVSNNITSGTGNGAFSPDMACSRSQVVTFLWRAAGSPQPSGANPFSDVTEGAWYYNAVLWAVENGITSGTTATTFAPDMPCSRSQVVTFLYRAAGAPEVSGRNPFSDVSKGAWYYNAVLWAVENGITSGTTPTTFAPDMTCSRSQVVTFLYRAED